MNYPKTCRSHGAGVTNTRNSIVFYECGCKYRIPHKPKIKEGQLDAKKLRQVDQGTALLTETIAGMSASFYENLKARELPEEACIRLTQSYQDTALKNSLDAARKANEEKSKP